MTKGSVREFGHRLGLVLAGLVLSLAFFFIFEDGLKIIDKQFVLVFAALTAGFYAAPRVFAWVISPFFRD